jgi:hypothetical protein
LRNPTSTPPVAECGKGDDPLERDQGEGAAFCQLDPFRGEQFAQFACACQTHRETAWVLKFTARTCAMHALRSTHDETRPLPLAVLFSAVAESGTDSHRAPIDVEARAASWRLDGAFVAVAGTKS